LTRLFLKSLSFKPDFSSTRPDLKMAPSLSDHFYSNVSERLEQIKAMADAVHGKSTSEQIDEYMRNHEVSQSRYYIAPGGLINWSLSINDQNDSRIEYDFPLDTYLATYPFGEQGTQYPDPSSPYIYQVRPYPEQRTIAQDPSAWSGPYYHNSTVANHPFKSESTFPSPDEYGIHLAASEGIDDADFDGTETAESETVNTGDLTSDVDDFAPYESLRPSREHSSEQWDNPQDDMPQLLWYIFPEEAQGPRVPLPRAKVKMKTCHPRRITAWHRSGHSLKSIVNRVKNIPDHNAKVGKKVPTGRSGKSRTKEEVAMNSFTMRSQRYCQKTGLLAPTKGKREGAWKFPPSYVKGILQLSNAQLFHRVIGKVERGSFVMTAPDDVYQGTPAASQERVALPTPKDIDPVIRKALEDAGRRDLPTFQEFLQRNPDRAQHWGLNPATGMPINRG
jgi:hypothetical protein